METKEQILKGASELFKRYGIKSITMDDLARHLSISKKTIYQFFNDKDDLVMETIIAELKTQKCELDTITQESEDILDEMMRNAEFMRKKIALINPSMLLDMRKYHPKAWQIFQEHKTGYIFESIKKSIEKGMAQGYFRKDINIDILSRMRVEQVEMTFNPDLFPPDKFSIGEISLVLFDHFVFGISTLKAHKRLNELKGIIESL